MMCNINYCGVSSAKVGHFLANVLGHYYNNIHSQPLCFCENIEPHAHVRF